MSNRALSSAREIAAKFGLPARGQGRVNPKNRGGYTAWIMASLEDMNCDDPFTAVAGMTLAQMEEAYNDTSERILFNRLDGKATTPVIAAAASGPAIDEEALIALIRKYAKEPIRIVVESVAPKAARELPDEHRHALFEKALRVVAAGQNLMLVGPAGSGKTTLAEQIARALDLKFEFTGALDSAYKLTGFIDAQGRIVNTAFRRAYEFGGLFLFDEIDGSLPGAILAFNAALANGHADFPDGIVARHPDFRVIAAANTFGHGPDRQYVGRSALDAASLDRFAMLEMRYDETLEKALCGNEAWLNRVLAVRHAVEKAKVRAIVSPRASIGGAKMLAAGLDRADVEEMFLWKGMDSATRDKVKAAF